MSKEIEAEENSMLPVVEQKEVSINIAVIGIGQAGSRIAEEFHKRGYDIGIINTSSQDLKFINILENV